MQQQASPSMMPVMPSFSPANITTEQIQKYLDENKKLILAIMDNQNLGKLAECAQYQAQLQKNLMYLAAIADAQPQVATAPPQMAPHPAMQQGAYYMQQQQAAAMGQQPGVFSPRMPGQAQFSSPLQMHDQRQLHQQHQQPMVPGQMNFRPTGPSPGAGGIDTRGPNKQEGPETGPRGGDGQASSAAAAGNSGGDGEQS